MQELPQILANGIITGAVYALVATGYALVYGVLRLINFAHGSILTAGAFAALAMAEHTSLPFPIVVLISLIIGAMLGIFIERIAYRPVRKAPPIVALITALGLTVVIENSIALLFGSDSRSLPSGFSPQGDIAIQGVVHITYIQMLTMALSGLSLILLWFIVNKANIGSAMRAAADDPELASAIGLNTNRIVSIAFAIGSGLAASSGVVISADIGCDPYMGTIIGFKAFAACVIGGIGSLEGAMLGGLLLGLLENIIGGYISTEFKNAFVMVVLILMLIVKPEGLFASTRRRTH